MRKRIKTQYLPRAAIFLSLVLLMVSGIWALGIPAEAATISTDTSWTARTLSGNLTINSGKTLTINGQITISGSVTISGSGTIKIGSSKAYFYIENGASLTINGITVDGAGISPETSASTLFTVKSGSLTLKNSTVTNCVKDGKSNGGAINVTQGTLTIENTTISNCSAFFSGGAIYASESTVTIKSGTFKGNKTTSPTTNNGGGFIYNQRSVLTIEGGTFSNNTSACGGAIFTTASSAGTKTYINGGTFTGNTATKSGFEGSGAIYVGDSNGDSDDSDLLSISGNATFTGSKTAGVDGIYLNYRESNIQITSALKTPLRIYINSANIKNNYTVAYGTDSYKLTNADAEHLICRSGNISDSTVWYSYYSVALEQIYLRSTTTHRHCICGAASCTESSHQRNLSWKAITDLSEITGDGNYYLLLDQTLSSTWTCKWNVNLCLNGKTLTGNSSSGYITVTGTLSLCDCKGTGAMINANGRVIYIDDDGKLNYYSGTLKGGKGNTEVAIYADGIVNLYAMPVIDTSCDYGIRGNSPGFLHICAKLSKPSKVVRINFGTGNTEVSMTDNTQVTVTTGWSTYMSGETPTDYFLPRLNRYANIALDSKELVLRRFHITFKNVDSTYDEGDAKYSNGKLSSIPGSPTRPGYAFGGWFTADGKQITTTYVFSDDTIVYARWTANTYTVTLNPGSGSVTPTTITVTFGGAYGTLPTPTLEGYTFKGWFTASSGGTVITDSTTVSRTADHTLYARWELIEVISVEITWGPMEFTYSDGDWNAEKHVYENGGWVPDTENGNCITVKNSGNVPVTVSFTYTAKNTAVQAVISDGSAAVTAPVALTAREQKQVWLTLSGKPTGTLTKAVLGTVTIKIGGT